MNYIKNTIHNISLICLTDLQIEAALDDLYMEYIHSQGDILLVCKKPIFSDFWMSHSAASIELICNNYAYKKPEWIYDKNTFLHGPTTINEKNTENTPDEFLKRNIISGKNPVSFKIIKNIN